MSHDFLVFLFMPYCQITYTFLVLDYHQKPHMEHGDNDRTWLFSVNRITARQLITKANSSVMSSVTENGYKEGNFER